MYWTLLLISLPVCVSSQPISRYTQTLHYSQPVFDSDTCCWRQLSVQGKHAESADLIVAYLHTHKNTQNPHSLRWHAGQLFAKAGDTTQAIRYFRKTYSWFYTLGGEEGNTWYLFAKGNIAFMQRDKQKLERIIAKWERKDFDRDLNYGMLKRLHERWTSPYGSTAER